MKKYYRNNIKIYNSLSGEKELFKPLTPQHVGMYVCGPTVYNKVHLGNCRTFIFFDLVFRYLKYIGYKVRYIRNITDVGHLENDNDEGEDKINKKAYLEKIEPMEIAQKYTLDFHKSLHLLNTLPPSIEPIATGHIIEQIELIKILIKKGFAYNIDGSIYFNTKVYNKQYNYGILSNQKINNYIVQYRKIKEQNKKHNIQDFALWKKGSPFHIMNWPSPWGKGFPGWHIECTSMSIKYLGKTFDIHGGGIDLKFPHHECELAQNQAIYGHPSISYWMHTNILTLNGQKMSKSTNNILLLEEIMLNLENNYLNKVFHPTIIRFFMLQAHYRSILDFSSDMLDSSERDYYRIIKSLDNLETISIGDISNLDILSWCKKCYEAMNDDFNTPLLISQLFKGVKYIDILYKKQAQLTLVDFILFKETMHDFIFKVLGLEIISDKLGEKIDDSESLIDLFIQLRNQERHKKNWILSDWIRKKLFVLGIDLQDTKKGTIFKRLRNYKR